MQTLFWFAFGFIAYVYVGYPLAIWLLSRLRAETVPDPATLHAWPSVTIVVAVHNEERRVERKIGNLKGLDYDPGRLRIVFVSDGSTDATNALIGRQTGVTLLEYQPRQGKPYALNFALERVDSDVVVFTDVRQQVQPTALRYLVARLQQPGVGAVSGELVHVDPVTHAAAHIGLYWRYEKWIRRAESRWASTVGVTGALYAIRRRDYVALPTDTLLDDFVLPMQIVRGGQRVVFESRAVIHDELQMDTGGERKRKVRTLTGNFQAFARQPWMFVPWLNPAFVQFMSHKVLRLFVPYALVLMLVASFFAAGPFYTVMAAGQTAFYMMALAGFAAQRLRRNRFISFAVVFLDLNWAAVVALGKFLAGATDARWEKT